DGELRAEGLGRAHDPPQARLAGRITDMLRADAEAYRAVGVPAEARTPGDDVGRDSELVLADTHREPVVALLESRLDEVHGRTADEARHEQVHRLVEHRLRLAGLLEHAAAHHGHAVAIVIASTWSCVT